MSGCGAPGERYAFASPAEAVAAMLTRVGTADGAGVESVELSRAGGRVLAEAIVADRDSPAVDVSAMDGYAVRIADLGRAELPVAAEIRIGREPPAMREGAVLRIVTGAPVPSGADAVLKREEVQERGETIGIDPAIAARLRPGDHVRRKGENVRAGQEVVGAGRIVSPAVVSALAMFGRARPRVYRRVRVGVLTTGDELRSADEMPTAWELRDSNGPTLAALLVSRPWLEVVGVAREADDPARIRAAAERLLRDADALLFTGGVSMGQRDFIPGVLTGLGAEVVFHRVPQRPGKPILAAVLPDGRPVFGLPGNPVSVMVAARRFAVPVLERLAGLAVGSAPSLARIEEAGNRTIDLWWHRLVRIVGPGVVEAVDGRGSGDVPAAARSDGFCEVPPGQGGPGPWPFYAWA